MKFQEFYLISNQQTWSGNATKKFGTFEDTAMLVSLIASTALALAVTTHGPHVVSEGQYTMKSWTLTESDFTIELEVPSSAKWYVCLSFLLLFFFSFFFVLLPISEMLFAANNTKKCTPSNLQTEPL